MSSRRLGAHGVLRCPAAADASPGPMPAAFPMATCSSTVSGSQRRDREHATLQHVYSDVAPWFWIFTFHLGFCSFTFHLGIGHFTFPLAAEFFLIHHGSGFFTLHLGFGRVTFRLGLLSVHLP